MEARFQNFGHSYPALANHSPVEKLVVETSITTIICHFTQFQVVGLNSKILPKQVKILGYVDEKTLFVKLEFFCAGGKKKCS